MEINQITVEVKKSKNFQTYTSSEVIEINKDDDIEAIRIKAFTRCRHAVMEQIKLDTLR